MTCRALTDEIGGLTEWIGEECGKVGGRELECRPQIAGQHAGMQAGYASETGGDQWPAEEE
jgi:hypothetical protein